MKKWSKASEETKKKMSIAKSGKNHPQFWKSVSQEVKDKIRAGSIGRKVSQETIDKRVAKLIWQKRTQEQKDKISKAHKWMKKPRALPPPIHYWEDNFNWKWGITEENHKIRTSLEYLNWRTAVFQRDDWTCQKCFKRWWITHAHHINNFADYRDLRVDVNNGITLCWKCHKEFHHLYGNQNNIPEQISKFLWLK